MCISAAMLAAIGSATAAVGTIYGVDQQRKQANHARDAATAAAAKVETDAANSANARVAQRRRALAANSLVTDQSASGMASTGRATLGGG